MSTLTTKYSVRVNTRQGWCRYCQDRLYRGELRLETTRGTSKTIGHAGCFLETEAAETLDIVHQLVGWTDLSQADQRQLAAKVLPSNTSAQASQAGAAPGPSQQESQQSGPNSQSSVPQQSVSVISNDDTLILISDDDEIDEDDDEDGYSDEGYNRSNSSLYSEEEFEPSRAPKVPRLSDGTAVMPNLLEGVNIPAGPARTGEECSVCLDLPVHPVTLPCGHVFCFLCVKGLSRQSSSQRSCSLCRREIPADFLDRSQVLAAAGADIEAEREDQADPGQLWTWFYEGRNGWWRFEERNSEELEETFKAGQLAAEMMICGQLYVIDFVRQEQYQKNFPTRKRKIKRDVATSESKGVAGLQGRK